MRSAQLSPLGDVLAAVATGQLVMVMDDESHEDEGDLVLAAELATRDAVALMIREARGLRCVPMSRARAGELGLTPMVATNDDPMRTAFTVTIDAAARHGVRTGISAADRATTARLAVTGDSEDFIRPGHLFSLIARTGGVLVRRGHTEAAPIWRRGRILRRALSSSRSSVTTARCFAAMNLSGSLTSGSCPSLRSRTSSLITPAMLANGMRRLLGAFTKGCS